jgi:hypothetical protein
MNGMVEFDYGVYSYSVEYKAEVEFDAGDYFTPPCLDWDVQLGDLIIFSTDENGKENKVDIKFCQEDFLTHLRTEIDTDITETFNNY